MKLSEIKGEAAIDVLVEIIDPISKILTDQDIKNFGKGKKNLIHLTKVLLKNHKNEVIDIMAAVNRTEREAYVKDLNLLTLPVAVIDLLTDPLVQSLFTSAAENGDENTFGSQSENAAEEI